MAAVFPLNERLPATVAGRPRVKSPATANAKARFKAVCPGLMGDSAYWDDADHECFLAALLEMEAEDRWRRSLAGRCSQWLQAVRRWPIENKDRAENLAAAAIVIAGIAVAIAWYVVSPWLARVVAGIGGWIGPAAWTGGGH
jgi:hypothetical protein